MDTNDLINRLGTEARPVTLLSSPLTRMVKWLAIAIPAVALMVIIMSPRADLAAKFGDQRYLIEQGAALATALLAAFAAFSAGIPGRSPRILWLPLVPLALWLGSLGQGCSALLWEFGVNGLSLRSDWICLPAIAMTGMVPGIALAVMIRHGAPLRPRTTVLLGAMASAALANVGLRLFHPEDASLMVLVWQFGTVALITVMLGAVGDRFLRWRHVLAR